MNDALIGSSTLFFATLSMVQSHYTSEVVAKFKKTILICQDIYEASYNDRKYTTTIEDASKAAWAEVFGNEVDDNLLLLVMAFNAYFWNDIQSWCED